MAAFPVPPSLSTPVVVLREWHDRDLGRLAAAALDPAIAAHAGLDPADDGSATRYVARQRLRRERGLGYSFAITESRTDRCNGQISTWFGDAAPNGATGYVEEQHGRVALAYWVAPDARGEGLAASALNALAPWLLRQPDVARLELFIEPGNEPSWRSAERGGFTREGLLRSWHQIGDRRRDVYIYSRLENDHAAPA